MKSNWGRSIRTAAGLAAGFATFSAFASAPEALEVAAHLGVTPAALAVAGFDAEDAGSLLDRLDAVSPTREQLGAALDARDEAAAEVSSLRSRLLIGAIDQETQEAYAQAAANLAVAESLAAQRLGSLWSIAMLNVAGPDVDAVETFRAVIGRRVPAEFGAIERTDHEWNAIERALRAEARVQRLGGELAQEHAALLAAIREDEAVIAAQSAIAGNLAAIRTLLDPIEE